MSPLRHVAPTVTIALAFWSVLASCHLTTERLSSPDAGPVEPAFYSYEGDSGRIVFVNDLSLVPSDKLDTVKPVDVSGVDLHEEYAASFARAVEEELEDLRESPSCSEARVETKSSTFARVLRRHGPWVIGLGVCLILVLMSPWMSRLLPGGEWSRLLMIAFPAIFFVTLIAMTATRANDSIHAVDELADLCKEAEQGQEPDPGAATEKQVGEVQRIKTLITRLYSERDAAIKQVLDSE